MTEPSPGNILSSKDLNEVKVSHKVPDYSLMTMNEKYVMSILLSTVGIWSTLSSSIYFPALPILSEKFVESAAVTNVSVVAYLLFQGIAPTFVAPLADAYGRRPLVLISLACYCGVCVGLARTNVYWLLVVLRCLQAAAIAPIVSVTTGSVGDICTRAERGNFVGIVSGIQLIGQAVGALIGAAVVSRFGWRGIFVLLAIGSGGVLIIALFIYPETNRLIVGNLSVEPKYFWNDTPLLHLPNMAKRLTNDDSTLAKSNANFKNTLTPFKIIVRREVFFVLLPGGLQFAAWTMSLTTLSTSLMTKYNFSVMKVGLCYLSPGMGALLGSIVSGRILNYVYKQKREKYEQERDASEDPENFPPFNIVRARLDLCIIPSFIAGATYVVFGWCIEYKVNIAPILISAFIFTFCAVNLMASLMTLVVDLFPNQGSAAASCVNLMRCLLAAAGVGVLQNMIDKLGEGGTFTIMAGFCVIGLIALIFMIRSITKNLATRSAEDERK